MLRCVRRNLFLLLLNASIKMDVFGLSVDYEFEICWWTGNFLVIDDKIDKHFAYDLLYEERKGSQSYEPYYVFCCCRNDIYINVSNSLFYFNYFV